MFNHKQPQGPLKQTKYPSKQNIQKFDSRFNNKPHFKTKKITNSNKFYKKPIKKFKPFAPKVIQTTLWRNKAWATETKKFISNRPTRKKRVSLKHLVKQYKKWTRLYRFSKVCVKFYNRSKSKLYRIRRQEKKLLKLKKSRNLKTRKIKKRLKRRLVYWFKACKFMARRLAQYRRKMALIRPTLKSSKNESFDIYLKTLSYRKLLKKQRRVKKINPYIKLKSTNLSSNLYPKPRITFYNIKISLILQNLGKSNRNRLSRSVVSGINKLLSTWKFKYHNFINLTKTRNSLKYQHNYKTKLQLKTITSLKYQVPQKIIKQLIYSLTNKANTNLGKRKFKNFINSRLAFASTKFKSVNRKLELKHRIKYLLQIWRQIKLTDYTKVVLRKKLPKIKNRALNYQIYLLKSQYRRELITFQKFISNQHYFSIRSVQWKFYNRRWYYMYRKWKRAKTFKWLMGKAWKRYRKLNKNFIFMKLFHIYFQYAFGISRKKVWDLWSKVRKINNLSKVSLLDHFNTALQLKLDGLIMLLGFAKNRLIAQEIINSGFIRINGLTVTDPNHIFTVKEMLQIDIKIVNEIKQLFVKSLWIKRSKHRLKFMPFLQIIWSIYLFMFIRWPYNYELKEESVITSRWLRFYLRYFPVKYSHYKEAKVKWLKY